MKSNREQSIYIVPGDSDTFRVEPSSWVYGWSSGRHSANVNHTVNGYLFHAANHNAHQVIYLYVLEESIQIHLI